jgi:hypothetical protein
MELRAGAMLVCAMENGLARAIYSPGLEDVRSME